MRISIVVLLIAIVPTRAVASEPDSYADDVVATPKVEAKDEPEIKLAIQYRPRFEESVAGSLRFDPDQGSNALTHRARIGTDVWYRNIRGHLSIQNIRTAGARQNDPAAELFEAYVEAHGEDWGLRVGPQMITFGSGRVVTAPIWSQRSRTFDAVRFVYAPGDFKADLWVARFNDGVTRDFFASNLEMKVGDLTFGMPVVGESNGWVTEDDRSGLTGDFFRVTGGFTAALSGKLHASAELLVQMGDFEGDGTAISGGTDGGDIMAYVAHADVGYDYDDILRPVLWVDYLSGDSDHGDDDLHTFDTIVGYRRRFYGRSDRFIFIPRDTGQGGLVDLAVLNKSKVGPGTIFFEGHYFLLPEENLSGAQGSVGTEVDFRYKFPLWDKVDLEVGSFWFFNIGDFADLEDDDVHDYHYVQLDLQMP